MKYLVYLLVLANVAYLGWNIHLQQTATGDNVTALPALPAGVAPLMTLEELEAQQQEEDVSGIEALTATQPPGTGAALACKTLGPFLVVDEMQAVSEELRQRGWQAQQRTAEIRQPDGFWVYLPSMGREEVLQAVKTLEENRDHDYYVGKGNFLALGTFTEESRAKVRFEQVRKLGFDPILEARYETSTAYWLDVEVQTPRLEELGAILLNRPGLKLQDTACP